MFPSLREGLHQRIGIRRSMKPFAVKIDHLLQCGVAPVVHVRPGQLDVPQRRCFKLSEIEGRPGDGPQSRIRIGIQSIIVEIVVREQDTAVTVETVPLFREEQAVAVQLLVGEKHAGALAQGLVVFGIAGGHRAFELRQGIPCPFVGDASFTKGFEEQAGVVGVGLQIVLAIIKTFLS